MSGDVVFRIRTEREENISFWASFVFQGLTWSRHLGLERRRPGVLANHNLCYYRIFKGAKLNAQTQLTTDEYY